MLNGTENKLDTGRFVWLQSPWVKWTAVALFVLWMFFVLSAYYVVQKSSSLAQALALGQNTAVWLDFSFSFPALLRSLLDMAAALWLAFVALGVGLWLLTWLKISSESALAMLLYGLGLGLGALGLLVLFLGLAGWLQPMLFYALLIGLTLLTGWKSGRFLRGIRPSRPPILISVYGGAVLFLALLQALLPPFSWDALSYHLTGPKLYLAAGQIRPGVDIAPLNYPALLEMLFMLAMAVRGDVAAKLLHFFYYFMLAGLVYVIARDYLRVKQSWMAVLFLLAAPLPLILSTQAYSDLPLAFYQVAALLAFFQWQKQRNLRWLVLSGALSGLALGLKYNSLITPLIIGALLLWDLRKEWRWGIRPLFAFTLPVFLIALPWYVKNMIFTGNPVYPFVFGGVFWDEFRAASFPETGTGLGFNPIAFLRLPYDITLGLKDATQDGPIGPFFLIFLPLILVYAVTKLGRAAPRPFFQLLFFALIQYLFWVTGVISSSHLWQSRFLLPAFIALCPVLAWLWQDLARFDHPQFSLQRFVGLALVFALILNLIIQSINLLSFAPYNYVMGSDSRDALLQRTMKSHYLAMQAINELPQDAVILFLYEPRSYYCERDCRPDIFLDQLAHAEYLYGSPDKVAEVWRDAGVTHVLIFEAGLNFFTENGEEYGKSRLVPGDEFLARLRNEFWTPVMIWEDEYSLYALKGGD
ncbi:MAG TPA: hypothetical protein EYP41_05605 [Anaerolineae bacterium]|nr:hypothetical protein [Anaerolineae bacterium]HIP71984.1 hypothetical protein [Anaerolineae bacterium]